MINRATTINSIKEIIQRKSPSLPHRANRISCLPVQELEILITICFTNNKTSKISGSISHSKTRMDPTTIQWSIILHYSSSSNMNNIRILRLQGLVMWRHHSNSIISNNRRCPSKQILVTININKTNSWMHRTDSSSSWTNSWSGRSAN